MNRYLFRNLAIAAVAGVIGLPVECARYSLEYLRRLVCKSV